MVGKVDALDECGNLCVIFVKFGIPSSYISFIFEVGLLLFPQQFPENHNLSDGGLWWGRRDLMLVNKDCEYVLRGLAIRFSINNGVSWRWRERAQSRLLDIEVRFRLERTPVERPSEVDKSRENAFC